MMDETRRKSEKPMKNMTAIRPMEPKYLNFSLSAAPWCFFNLYKDIFFLNKNFCSKKQNRI
jgi:hypothetical protein